MYNPDAPLSPRTLHITAEEAGQRLDRYLAIVLGDLSRTGIQQLIADGLILVNGRLSKPGYSLRSGDEVQVVQVAPRPQSGNVRAQQLPLDIVYEDRDLLVINKAAGMVVHPAPG